MSATYRTLELRGAERAGDAYDEVARPSHYCHGGMEAKEVIAAFLADAKLGPASAWWWGNAIKYLLRWPYKGLTASERLRDLAKARECIDQLEARYRAEDAAARRRAAEMAGGEL